MASTYSPSLRLELMATGDQSGTWGDTTNTNLGTLLEQAITGYLSTAQGDVANKTLTSLDGAFDEARNMVINMTGALTAARNVVVPTAEKVYLFRNSTTGGFSLTIKTTAGTGVSVAPGTAQWVYCDGINVVQALAGTLAPQAANAVAITGGSVDGLTSLSSTGTAVGYVGFTTTSTEAGATAGPIIDTYRNSASPAASDVLGQIQFNGRDSAANKQEYAAIEAVISSPTSATEAGALNFYATAGGSRARQMSVGPNNPNTPTQFIEGYSTTATAAGTTTLTVASAKNQYFTGTTTQTVVLPVTSTLVLGQQFRIVNNSTGLVTVQSSGANTIQVMGGTGIAFAPGAPGTELVVTCIAITGTGTASWAFKYDAPTTAWVAYTPTFTAFGATTNVSFQSRRVGGSLEVRGVFTTGTPVATEVRVSLGFNGGNSNVTSSVPTTQVSGVWVRSATTASYQTMVETASTYMVVVAPASAGGTKLTGAAFGSGELQSVQFTCPISGW